MNERNELNVNDGNLSVGHSHSYYLIFMPTTLPIPLAGPSSNKRKLEDCDDFSATEDSSSDNASDAADKSRTGKKVKHESQDDDESEFIPSEHISEATATENLVNYSTPTTLFPLLTCSTGFRTVNFTRS